MNRNISSRKTILILILLSTFISLCIKLKAQPYIPIPERGIRLTNSMNMPVDDAKVIFDNDTIFSSNGWYSVPYKNKNVYLNITILHPSYQTLIYHHVRLKNYQEAGMLLPNETYYYPSNQFKFPCEKNTNRILVLWSVLFDRETNKIIDDSLFQKRIDSLGLKIEASKLPFLYNPPMSVSSGSTIVCAFNGKTTQSKVVHPKHIPLPPEKTTVVGVLIKKDSSDFSDTNCVELMQLRKYGYTAGPLITRNFKTQEWSCYEGKISIYCSYPNVSDYYYCNTVEGKNLGFNGMNELIEKLYAKSIDDVEIEPEMFGYTIPTSD